MNDDILADLACTIFHDALAERPFDRQDAMRRAVAAVAAIRKEWSASEARAFVQRKVRAN